MAEVFFHVRRFRIQPLPAPELRKDPIVDRWVIISTDRLGRPQELGEPTDADSLETCPFCAGNEHLTPPAMLTMPGPDGWRVRIVPNTFPAIRGKGPFVPRRDGLLHGGVAGGLHEVAIECPNHESNAALLTADHLADLFQALAQRLRELARDRPGLYPVVFKNHGAAAGATLTHAHTQIIGLPFVPATIQQELDGGRRHGEATGRCVFCSLLEQERSAGKRVIFESASFIALAPYASRFPCEVWILPKAHGSHFERVAEETLVELGAVYGRVLRQLDAALDDPPYNVILHTAPLDQPDLPHYHWHLEMLPRLTGLAGFECGVGQNINPVPPEQAAAYLRQYE